MSEKLLAPCDGEDDFIVLNQKKKGDIISFNEIWQSFVLYLEDKGEIRMEHIYGPILYEKVREKYENNTNVCKVLAFTDKPFDLKVANIFYISWNLRPLDIYKNAILVDFFRPFIKQWEKKIEISHCVATRKMHSYTQLLRFFEPSLNRDEDYIEEIEFVDNEEECNYEIEENKVILFI